VHSLLCVSPTQIYRLLTRKTYEMQMFHMASLKMGLDQAILNGFEVGSAGEGAFSKDEVERLLRNGAYEIFKEDRAGKAEEESNEFIQQDIDTIMRNHARTVVHDSSGSSGRPAAGSTFSKASFKVAKSPDAAGKVDQEDVDIDDPEFWKKVVGDTVEESGYQEPTMRRERLKMNFYAEAHLAADIDHALLASDSDAKDEEDDDASEGDEQGDRERSRWGGTPEKGEWQKDDFEYLVKLLATHGYDGRVVQSFKLANPSKPYSDQEVSISANASTLVCIHGFDLLVHLFRFVA
jgi:hypothetical protein